MHQTVALRESSPGVGTLRRGDSVEDIDLPLVRRARRGERGAFEALTERYDRRLRALAFRMLGDPDLMDDALQEVAIKAFVSLRGFRGEAAFGTWLFRLTYTTCLNMLRSRSRHPLAETGELPDLPDPGP